MNFLLNKVSMKKSKWVGKKEKRTVSLMVQKELPGNDLPQVNSDTTWRRVHMCMCILVCCMQVYLCGWVCIFGYVCTVCIYAYMCASVCVCILEHPWNQLKLWWDITFLEP